MSEYDDIQSQLKAWAGFVSSGYEVPAAGGTMSEAGTEDDDVDYDLIGAWDIVIGVARKALGGAS